MFSHEQAEGPCRRRGLSPVSRQRAFGQLAAHSGDVVLFDDAVENVVDPLRLGVHAAVASCRVVSLTDGQQWLGQHSVRDRD